MIVIIGLLTLFDATFLPVSGILTGLLWISILLVGVWKIKDHKKWFALSLIYISLATLLFFFGGGMVEEVVIHKLSDWSLIFLVLGAVRLARFSK